VYWPCLEAVADPVRHLEAAAQALHVAVGVGDVDAAAEQQRARQVRGVPRVRGLHSSTFQLNVSADFWDRGCKQWLSMGCLGGLSGY